MARVLTYLHAYPLLPAEANRPRARALCRRAGARSTPSVVGTVVDSAGCRGCHLPDLIGGGGPPPGAANITPVGIGD